MDAGVQIAIVSAVSATCVVAAPIMTIWLTGKQKRREKLDDWSRQDEVARKAAEQGERLIAATKEASLKVGNLGGQVQQVHALVNSGYTEQMRAILKSTHAQLVLMKTLLAKDPSSLEASATMIKKLEADIAAQEIALAERIKATAAPTLADQNAELSSAASKMEGAADVMAKSAAVAADAVQKMKGS